MRRLRVKFHIESSDIMGAEWPCNFTCSIDLRPSSQSGREPGLLLPQAKAEPPHHSPLEVAMSTRRKQHEQELADSLQAPW